MKTIQLAVLMVGLSLLTFESAAQPTSFLTNGLIAYYPFNGNANDASGNGNNGVVLTGASFVPDRFGVAASALRVPFGAMMTAPLNYVIEPTNAFTISVWADLFSLSGHYPTIVRLNYQCNSFSSLIRYDNVKFKKFVGIVVVNCVQAGSHIVMPQSLQTNYWYYLTLTFANGSLSFYADGVLIGRTHYKPTVPYSASPDLLSVGQTNTANYEIFDGIVDDIRIYNRALSSNEVAQLYSIESAQPLSSTNRLSTGHSATTSNPTVEAASKLLPPTNKVVAITQGNGEVVVFDTKGFILKSNDTYLPRTALTNVSEQDFHTLLECKTVYDALTAFGYSKARTANSHIFESQLREIWSKGVSLSDKIQTRTVILEEMRRYNDALTQYANSLGFASGSLNVKQTALGNAGTKAMDAQAASEQIDKASELRLYGITSGRARMAESQANKNLKQANDEMNAAIERAGNAAAFATTMKQKAEAYRYNCEIYANLLASYGLTVAKNPPFEAIPPLSLRFEVDVER